MLALALRNVSRHKLRTGMTLAAIACGVAALILSGGFIQDVYVQLAEAIIHSQSGHLQVAKAGFFGRGSRSPEKLLLDDPASEKDRIVAVPGVADAMARLSFSGLLSNGQADLPILGEGIEPDKEAKLGTYLSIRAGRALEASDAYGIVLGEGVAKTLQLHPGNQVHIVVSTPDGAMNTLDFEVVGVFQSFLKEYDARAVRIPLQAAQELLNTRGAAVIVVSLQRTAHTDAVARVLAESGQSRGLEVRTWTQLNDFYENTVALYERQFGALQLIILAMVLLSVVNSVNMSLFERVGEFGTMRAVGDRGRKIFALVVTESVLLGLIGAMLGVLIGIGAAIAISTVGIQMPPPPNSNLGYTAAIRLMPSVIAGAFIVGWVAAVVASVLPAWRVSRIPVVDALRQNV